MNYRNIERLYNCIHASLFTIMGNLDYDRITDAIILLCETLSNTDTDESVWSIGEFCEASLGDFIVGAYWFYSDHHGGQASKEYQALSALGGIFSPGMSELEPDSPEQFVYDCLADIWSNYHD